LKIEDFGLKIGRLLLDVEGQPIINLKSSI